jgi:hypothetical protein
MNAHGNLIAKPFVFSETSFAFRHHGGPPTEFRWGPHTYAPIEALRRGLTRTGKQVRKPNPPFGDAPWRNGERQ